MRRSTDRILATHVGSLIRPPKLVAFLRAQAEGKDYDKSAFEACLSESIAELVQQQKDVGVDIVSDGEFSKGHNWAFYIHDRLGGISRRPLTEAERADPKNNPLSGRDRSAFPEFYADYDKASGLAGRIAFKQVVEGKLTYTGQAAVQRDIANLKAAVDKAGGGVEAFLPVVAPASAMPDPDNQYYKTDEDLLFGLAEALHEEYKAITDAGLIVQIDDAYLPYMFERMPAGSTLADYRKWAGLMLAALNHALEGIPEDQARYHICWGSWNGPHAFDLEIKEIADLLMTVNVGAYLFEAANPRHAHEWKIWRDVKVPEGKTLIPGVISHATNVVEHPELVKERIVRLAGIVGRENVMGGTDCGFAQSPFAKRVHETIMWAKLESLAEGCRLASDELWGRRSAA